MQGLIYLTDLSGAMHEGSVHRNWNAVQGPIARVHVTFYHEATGSHLKFRNWSHGLESGSVGEGTRFLSSWLTLASTELSRVPPNAAQLKTSKVRVCNLETKTTDCIMSTS